MSSPGAALSTGQREELAELLADQFASLDEVRPSAARVEQDGDLLRFDFAWPLAPWEELLANRGDEARVRRFRSDFLRAISPSLGEVVAMTTRRAVSSSRPEVTDDLRLAGVSFVLGAATDERPELEAGIRNWSEQVRRNAKRQRSEHRKRVEELRRLTREVQQTRLGRGGQPRS